MSARNPIGGSVINPRRLSAQDEAETEFLSECGDVLWVLTEGSDEGPEVLDAIQANRDLWAGFCLECYDLGMDAPLAVQTLIPAFRTAHRESRPVQSTAADCIAVILAAREKRNQEVAATLGDVLWARWEELLDEAASDGRKIPMSPAGLLLLEVELTKVVQDHGMADLRVHIPEPTEQERATRTVRIQLVRGDA